MNLHNRTAQIVAGVYFGLVLLSFLPLALVNDPLAGMLAMTLTQPWSYLFVLLLDAVNPALLDSGLGVLTTLLGGVINAGLVYVLIRVLGNFTRRSA